jgi:hypothetical protein
MMKIYNNGIPLQFHCTVLYRIIIVVRIMAGGTEQFSITLPIEAIDMIEKGLIPFGLYGKKRGTVAAALILDMLKQPAVRSIVDAHMKPAS